VNINPMQSASFTNGVWTGNLKITQAANAVSLCSDDGAGHIGLSNPFNVFGPPAIMTQPTSQTVVAMTDATFAAAADAQTPLTWQWQFNNTNLSDNMRISGVRSNLLTLGAAGAPDAGNYQVIARNAYGSTTSKVAVLTVLKVTPAVNWTNPASIIFG